MRLDDLSRLVRSTSDPAFAVDSAGLIVAWNRAAEELFGIGMAEAISRHCGSIVQGMDECGMVCSEDCTIRQAVQRHHPVSNFDLRVQTQRGRQWCNVSVLVADEPGSTSPCALYIMRPIELRKKLEMLVRDFLVTETSLPPEQAIALISSTRAPARETELTDRELEILRLLARGETTATVSEQLHISRTTVNNHIQHILRKLDAHTRLEAIRRAEHAGLI